MSKKPFLVVYDYGMGGIWAVIFAETEIQISEKYPWLKVMEPHPSWMTEQEYKEIAASMSFDIDVPHGWLLSTALNQNNKA